MYNKIFGAVRRSRGERNRHESASDTDGSNNETLLYSLNWPKSCYGDYQNPPVGNNHMRIARNVDPTWHQEVESRDDSRLHPRIAQEVVAHILLILA